MSDDYIEKDYDDEVYEDGYYEEHYNEEELSDSDENLDEDDDSEGSVVERKINISFACEECDYRWDDVIIKRKNDINDINDIDDDYEADAICPMCGSVNVTLI